MVELHEHNVDQVDGQQHIGHIGLNHILPDEEAHEGQVQNEQKSVSGRDPPVDPRPVVGQRVEEPLDDQPLEGTLLHRGLDADVRHSEEDAVHHDETLGS